MAGILTNLREDFAEFLRGDVASGAKAYFTDNERPIEVFTEKLKSFEDKITAAFTATGIGIIVATATASRAKNNSAHGELGFGEILLVARVFESPDTNDTDVSASDAAEVIALLSRHFKAFGKYPLALQSIGLGNDPDRLCYDVTWHVEARAEVARTRPGVITAEDETALSEESGTTLETEA